MSTNLTNCPTSNDRPVTLTDEETFRIERLVALNAERAAEEARGIIRWLRPDFQNPSGASATQKELAINADEEPAARPTKKAAQANVEKLPLPSSLPEQVVAIRQQLTSSRESLTAADMAKRFSRARSD